MGTLNFGGFKLDTTYPREGTETFCLRRSVRRWRTQLIPARGRKLDIIEQMLYNIMTQLIPARGRKPKKLQNRFLRM